METAPLEAALNAAKGRASALGLRADDVEILQASNRLAVRLLPCDVLARVTPVAGRARAAFEVEVARRLTALGSPVAGLDPRIEPRLYEHGGFVTTFWAYYAPVPPEDVEPAEFAEALQRLHADMRECDLPAPHFSVRVAETVRLVSDPALTPDLGDADRELLMDTVRELSTVISRQGAPEQLLHGEPHPGNVLRTANGLLFTDLETCCRAPVEFDIAHYARVGPDSWEVDAAHPERIGELYPHADRKLIRAFFVMWLVAVAARRCDPRDQFPEREERRDEWLGLLRAAVERHGADASR